MALSDEMVKAGSYMFKRRSGLPLLFLPVLIVALVDFEYFGGSRVLDYLWEAICGAMAVAGLSLRAFTVGRVPARTTGRNTEQQVAETLNVTGMYSIVRHPLYLGNFLIWLGVASFARSWWLVVMTIMAFSLYYERIMLAEEEFLRGKFGRDFEDWAARTPAFIPALGKWTPSDLSFSWKTVLSRENSTLLGTVAIFFLLKITGDFFAGTMPRFDLVWASLMVASVVVYGIVRWLKKKGRLAVEGR